MINAPPRRYIVEIFQEHLEEISFLCEQRVAASNSSFYNSPELEQLEERIKAHIQGLLIGKNSIEPILTEYMVSSEPSLCFAAAYILLLAKRESLALQVLDLVRVASNDLLPTYVQALCHGPIQPLTQQLRDIFASGPPHLASAAGEVLAFHKQLDPNSSRLHEFFSDDDPEVRRTGWRILALLA